MGNIHLFILIKIKLQYKGNRIISSKKGISHYAKKIILENIKFRGESDFRTKQRN